MVNLPHDYIDTEGNDRMSPHNYIIGKPVRNQVLSDHHNSRRSSRKRIRTDLFSTFADSDDIQKLDLRENTVQKKDGSTGKKQKSKTKAVRKLKFDASKTESLEIKSILEVKSKGKPNYSSPSSVKKSNPKRVTTPNRRDKVIFSKDLENINPSSPWMDLKVPPKELRPSATLTTGQCFHWMVVTPFSENKTGKQKQQSAWGTHNAVEWIGSPVQNRVIGIRETPVTTLYRVLCGSSEGVEGLLRDYFQLDVPLDPLYKKWAAVDGDRMSRIAKVIPGVRILQQDPVECLFSFLCSSNNNIPRITLMLSRLRERYGTKLLDLPYSDTSEMEEGSEDEDRMVEYLPLYSFPTLDDLKSATEQEFRDLGLGYRAKYIFQTRDLLIKLGGESYLQSLKERTGENQTSDDIQNALVQFSGIGQKVADCVALFSLNVTDAIPVDVHVRNIAARDYDDLKFLEQAKSLTPKIYNQVGELFRSRFGSHSGWAHSLLFVAELPSFREVLPIDMVQDMDQWKEQERAKKAAEKEAKALKKSGN